MSVRKQYFARKLAYDLGYVQLKVQPEAQSIQTLSLDFSRIRPIPVRPPLAIGATR